MHEECGVCVCALVYVACIYLLLKKNMASHDSKKTEVIRHVLFLVGEVEGEERWRGGEVEGRKGGGEERWRGGEVEGRRGGGEEIG